MPLDAATFQKSTTQHDVAMVYLSGHDTNDSNGFYYHLPYNFNRDRLKSTGLPFSDIKHTVESLAGKVLFFVDSCHSGNVLCDDSEIYGEIDEATARCLMVSLIHKNLAYGVEYVPDSEAVRLTDAFFAHFDSGSRFFSNVSLTYSSWAPATNATFDQGLLVIGSTLSGCFWVEAED